MTFKLKHSLKKHQLVHKPEFGHTCDFCGKKFKVGVPIFLFLSVLWIRIVDWDFWSLWIRIGILKITIHNCYCMTNNSFKV